MQLFIRAAVMSLSRGKNAENPNNAAEDRQPAEAQCAAGRFKAAAGSPSSARFTAGLN
jgi:hypothetical protein